MTARPGSPSRPALLLLASASPRRRALLESAGIRALVCPAKVDEALRPGEGPEACVSRLARLKAQAGLAEASARGLLGQARASSGSLVLGADTVVVHEGRILGKPADEVEAHEMLSGLADSWHGVWTGWCILQGQAARRQGVSTTRVRFKALWAEELRYYLGTGEWRDKAGAYGIQGAAAFFVAELQGSYTNVVGLPLAEVVEALGELGASPEPLAGVTEPQGLPGAPEHPGASRR